MTYIDQIINAVGDIPLPEQEGHERVLANTLFALLAAALAKLPEWQREEILGDIEGGALRQAVQMYPAARQWSVGNSLWSRGARGS
jgi:hypothetical protein